MRLNQAVAIEKDVKKVSEVSITSSYQNIQKSDLLGGFNKVYTPRKEDGEVFPSESKRIQLHAETMIQELSEAFANLLDATLTRDAGNCIAKADVVVDGVVLLKDVPVPTLIWLEKKLVDVRTFASKLPTLSEAESWAWDTATATWVTAPEKSQRTAKINKHVVIVPATDKHPAQVAQVSEDVIIGDWTIVKRSSALTPDRVKDIQERVDKLMRAVKFARQEANTTEIKKQTVGKTVFSYLFPPMNK